MRKNIAIVYTGVAGISIIMLILSRVLPSTPERTLLFDTYFVAAMALFYLITILFYFKHFKIVLFSVLALINVVGYFMVTNYTGSPILYSWSFFASLLAVLVAFIIYLNEKYMDFLPTILLAFSVYNHMFYTLYAQSNEGRIISFFGPFPEDIEVALYGLHLIRDILAVGVVFAGAYLLYYLASGNKYWNYKRKTIDS